jgi:hypothetical protein
MYSTNLVRFREKLQKDNENLSARRKLHENYEWLESFWRKKYNGENLIDQFSREFEDFYWELEDFRDIARKFSSYPPVGNSKMNFDPSEKLRRATYFLRHHCDLNEERFPDLEGDEKKTGNKWAKSKLNAVLTMTKQVRDNLFHGQKMQLRDELYKRNKKLVSMAVEVTEVILNNLEKAERSQIEVTE